MKKVALTLIAFLLAGSGNAQPNYNDTVNCKWRDGRDMNERDCNFFRKLKADDEADEAAHQKKVQERLNAQRQELLAQERVRADSLAAEKQANENRNELDLQKQKVLAEQEAKEEKLQEAKERRVTAQLKKQCGADFRRPMIGQTVTRFQLCVAQVDEIGQINRTDGVVTTYEGSGYIIQAMNGRVVAWTR